MKFSCSIHWGSLLCYFYLCKILSIFQNKVLKISKLFWPNFWNEERVLFPFHTTAAPCFLLGKLWERVGQFPSVSDSFWNHLVQEWGEGWVWWCTSAILVLPRLLQELGEFEASFSTEYWDPGVIFLFVLRWAGETAHQLRAMAALSQSPSLISSIHMVSHTIAQLQEIQYLPLAQWTPGIHMVHRHTCR